MDEPPRSLSDYKQQFIPSKILDTFNPQKVDIYKDISTTPGIVWKEYPDYEHIIAYLYELKRKYPHLVKLIQIGTTIQKRPLLVIKISPPEGRSYDRIFIEGGIHANEWISPATVLNFIDKLVTEWRDLPYHMRTKTWLILPLTNPDGYVNAQSSNYNRDWRKNCKIENSNCVGVDLNRNFGMGWDKNEINEPCALLYKGSKSFSERETKAIRDFLLPQKQYLKAYISFHSYGQEVRYLWIYSTPIVGRDRIAEVAKEAIAKVNSTTGNKKCKYKIMDKPEKGLFGLARDWARKDLNVRYSYTVKLRDKGKQGFKLNPKFIVKTGIDAYSFMTIISKAIYDDYNKLKKNYFMKQDFHVLLKRQSHLFKRQAPV